MLLRSESRILLGRNRAFASLELPFLLRHTAQDAHSTSPASEVPMLLAEATFANLAVATRFS